jgi:hypothetical protein
MAIVSPEYIKYHHLSPISKTVYAKVPSYVNYATDHPTLDDYHMFIG